MVWDKLGHTLTSPLGDPTYRTCSIHWWPLDWIYPTRTSSKLCPNIVQTWNVRTRPRWTPKATALVNKRYQHSRLDNVGTRQTQANVGTLYIHVRTFDNYVWTWLRFVETCANLMLGHQIFHVGTLNINPSQFGPLGQFITLSNQTRLRPLISA